MANEPEEKKIEAAQEPKKNKKKLLIIIIAAVVVLLGGGGAFFFLRGGSQAPVADAHATGETSNGGGHGSSQDAAPGAGNGSTVSLEPLVVNLQDNSGTRYLKLSINLEIAADSSDSELKAMNAQIRDSLIILLSSKSYSDIGTVEGKYQLRDEIVARVNQFLVKSKAKTAYFTEFVIQ